jgi:hypothetical protein
MSQDLPDTTPENPESTPQSQGEGECTNEDLGKVSGGSVSTILSTVIKGIQDAQTNIIKNI